MKVRYILDTNTFSYIASGRSQSARAEFRRGVADPEAQICLSVLTEAEVRAGMNRRGLSPARREAIEQLFTAVEVLPWASEEAKLYGQAMPQLRAAGIGISLMDLLIGVQATAAGGILVTHDDVFRRAQQILGLREIVDWATDLNPEVDQST